MHRITDITTDEDTDIIHTLRKLRQQIFGMRTRRKDTRDMSCTREEPGWTTLISESLALIISNLSRQYQRRRQLEKNKWKGQKTNPKDKKKRHASIKQGWLCMRLRLRSRLNLKIQPNLPKRIKKYRCV